MRSATQALLVVSGVMIGGLGATGIQGLAGAGSAEPAAAEAAPTVVPVAPNDGPTIVHAEIDREALRSVVRDELAQALAAHQARDDEPEAAPIAARTPAQERAARDARDVFEEHVEGALAEGVWDDDDREAVVGAVGRMSREDREELVGTLIRAINEGRVVVTSNGPPWS